MPIHTGKPVENGNAGKRMITLYEVSAAQADVNSLLCIPQPALHTRSLYFGCVSACTAHPQPLLWVCLSMYCTVLR